MTNCFCQLLPSLRVFAVLVLLMIQGWMLAGAMAQTAKPAERKPGLVFFNDQLVSTEKAFPQFQNLFGRTLVSIPELDFVAAEDIVIDFDVRVRPDGTVDYVRSRRCNPEWNEYRKGGLFALYNAKFNPVASKDDQWIQVVYTFPGIRQ